MEGGYAPVSRLGVAPKAAPATYLVQSGDTLYSIAWTYGVDYQQVVRRNHLSTYHVRPGQILYLTQAKQTPYFPRHHSNTLLLKNTWIWPAKGKIIQEFRPGFAGNAGIDIGGNSGNSIMAALKGLVVYSGDGVRGYGNLIIIKHGEEYLSAYAFNLRNLVKVGDQVQAGQRIGTMGTNAAGRPALHFEIRRDGQPVNPLNYL